MQNILALLGLLTVSSHTHDDYMMLQWFIGLSVCSVILGVFVARFVHWLPATLFSYILLNATFTFACRWNYYGLHAHHLIYPATIHALGGATTLLLVTFCVLCLSGTTARSVFEAIPFFTVINSLLVLWAAIDNKILSGNTGYSGLMDNASINGCLIASCFVFLVSRGWWMCCALALSAIVASKSSVPYGILAVGLAGLAIKRKMLSGVFLVICVFMIGYAFEKQFLFNSSGRFEAYKIFMTAWWEKGQVWFGTGLGSFNFIAPTIQCQKLYGVSMVNGECIGTFWGWLHSDWLELLFCLGIVGFVLALIVAANVAFRLYKYKGNGHEELFSVWLSLCAFAMFNYPQQFFVVSFLFVFIIFCSYRLKPIQDLESHHNKMESYSKKRHTRLWDCCLPELGKSGT